jgi:16S rRNA (adenine1518-N6/adenine1519-N6)-dimethyltransferase
MDLTSPQNIQALLQKHGFQPQKRFGQNFLTDREAIEKITKAAEIAKNDLVLEIGPGLGVLTRELAREAGKVVAVEKDPKMVEILKETVGGSKNTEVILGDALRTPYTVLRIKDSFKIVGNLPFYITAPVIRRFLEAEEVKPKSMTLVVQKEVGERICAKPPKMSILANSIQLYAEPEMIALVPKSSFWPQPDVDAAIIGIIPLAKPRLVEKELFFKIMKAGFIQPRKQLVNNLSGGLKIDKEKTGAWLLENNIQPNRRAETLSVDDWIHLTETYGIIN